MFRMIAGMFLYIWGAIAHTPAASSDASNDLGPLGV
jgi:hypothetical protein